MLDRLRLHLFVAMGVCLACLAGRLAAQSPGAPQSDPAKPAPVSPVLESHGWMTIRDDRDQSTVLLHLPPRGALGVQGREGGGGSGGGGGGAEWGTVRIAPGVSHPVDAVAAHGNRVWLALQPERNGSDHIRRVVTLSAVRSLGGSWEYPPGRPEVCPPLPGQPELVGFAASNRGPIALLRGRSSGEQPQPPDLAHGALRMLVLQAGRWIELNTPWTGEDHVQTGGFLGLASSDTTTYLLSHPFEGDIATCWECDLPEAPSSSEHLEVNWRKEDLSLSDLPAEWRPDSLLFIGESRNGQVIGMRTTPRQELELVAYRSGGAARIATLPNVPRVHRAAALHGTRSLAILWWETPPETTNTKPQAPGSTSARAFRILEVSAASGRVLYDGPTVGGGVFSAREFQTLAVALLLVTAAVLLFALRGDGGLKIKLPPDFAPAAPLPRLLAAMADLAPGILLASMAMNVSIESMFNPLVMLGPTAEPMVWPVALLFTIIHCTLGEWITGRSLGKSLVGLQVAAVRIDSESGEPRLAPLRLWQAAIRNVLRWSIPALGMLLLVDSTRRYPPDLAARTIVLAPVPPDEDDEE